MKNIADFAGEVEISPAFLSEIESSRKVASLTVMQRIADELHVGLDDILVDPPVRERARYGDLEIVRLESDTIRILRDGVIQNFVVKDQLSPIAKAIGVNEHNTNGKLKNTRTLGADIIRALGGEKLPAPEPFRKQFKWETVRDMVQAEGGATLEAIATRLGINENAARSLVNDLRTRHGIAVKSRLDVHTNTWSYHSR